MQKHKYFCIRLFYGAGFRRERGRSSQKLNLKAAAVQASKGAAKLEELIESSYDVAQNISSKEQVKPVNANSLPETLVYESENGGYTVERIRHCIAFGPQSKFALL